MNIPIQASLDDQDWHFAAATLLVGLAASSRGADWTRVDLKAYAGKSKFNTLKVCWTLPRGARVIDGVPWNIDGIVELRGYDYTARTHADAIRTGDAFERIHLLNACSGRATNGMTIAGGRRIMPTDRAAG